MSDAILRVEGLEVCYGKSTAVHGIDLGVAEGEVAALLGRNGSGRSTTLKAIMGMVPPRGGRITFAGQEIAGLAPYRVARAGIAYVPEERRVFANLTVGENLELAAMRGRGGYWNPIRIGEVFPILAERARQPARTLSGGQQQMLAIGRALAANPGLILLDEPLEGLAPAVALDVEEAILALKGRGTTMLLVEHNSEMALRVADRGSILELGTVVASGPAAELSADTALVHRYLAV
ncbi:MAG TPA: ABC transporter ATP-binding protein [Acidimicrobiia bacterium]|nr:ABC transporter ATP-binding protein [Acidimicrobiia bacterium]